MEDLFTRIKNKALQAVQGVSSFVQQNPSPASFVGNKINQAIPGGVQGGVQRVQQSFQNPSQYNFFDNLAKGNINTGIKPLNLAGQTAGKYLNNWIVDPIVQIPNNINTIRDPNRGIIDKGIAGLSTAGALFPGDEAVFATLNAIKAKAAGRDPFQAFLGEEMSGLGDAVTGGQDNAVAGALNALELPLMLAMGGLKNKNKIMGNVKGVVNKIDDVVQPKQIPEYLTPIQQRQQRALEMAKTAPKTVEKPVPFSETPEGIDYTKYQTIKVQENVIKKGYNEEVIKRLVDEGYKPNWVDNILSKAKDPERLKSDPDYAYNYFKKSAEAEGIKPIKKINQILQSKPEPVQSLQPQPKPYRERLVEAKTLDEVQALRQESDRVIQDINTIFKKHGVSFQDVVKDLESGKQTPDTKILTEWLDIHKSRAEADLYKGINTKDNYFPHYTKEAVNDLITNPPKPDTFSGILTDPGFSNKRTGKLENYEITPEVLKAYQNDALRNAGIPEIQKIEIKISQEIAEEFRKSSNVVAKGTSLAPQVDVVGKLQSIPIDPGVPKTVFNAPQKTAVKEGVSGAFRSVNDRAKMAGEQFYNTFLWPFRKVEQEVNQFAGQISKLDDARLQSLYSSQTGRSIQGLSREDLIMRLVLEKNSSLNRGATEMFKEAVKNSEFKQPWLKNLANEIFDEYVGSGLRTSGATERILGAIRSQAGRGALGLNVGSALNNVFELKRAFSVIGTNELATGFKRVMSGENFSQKYGIDSVSSTALERLKGRNVIGRTLEAVDKGLFYMFDKTEKFKDQIMLAGFEQQGIKKGLNGEALTKFVLQKFDQFAIKYGKGNDVGLYKSPLLKTIFQFGQYPIKDLVIAIDKAGGALKGDRGDASYIAKYAVSSVAQMMIFKAVLGKIGFGDQTNTPIDVMQNISEGEVPMTPAVKALFGIAQNLSDKLTGNELDEYDQDQRDKSISRSMAVASIPASNQLYYKTGKTIENQARGYQEKFTGNVANPVSTDPAGVVKSLLFGPSYDPKRMEYIDSLDSGSAGLDKTQSAVFKNLPKEEQVPYYDASVAGNKRKAENKKVIESLENPKKQSFFDSLLGKKEDTTPKWGIEPKTAQEKKEHKSLVVASLETGTTVPTKDIQRALFDNKSASSSLVQERMDVYKALEKALDNENYTEEQKQAIIKASGAKEEAISYYLTARKDMDVKLQELTPILESMPPEERLQFLATGRMKLGGQQLVTSEMITYLYDNELIGENEKELLSNLKFDEGKNKFYTSLKFSKGSKKKLTFAQAKKLYSIPKIKFNSSSSIKQTRSSDDKLLEEILLKKP